MFRRLVFVASLAAAVAASPAAALAQHGQTQAAAGSTQAGLFTPSADWSFGFQLGSDEATGLSAQRAGFKNGALTLGLGLANGTTTVSADWTAIFSQDFVRRWLPDHGAYNTFRGELNPFIGGGIQVGRGLALRLPVGVQYTFAQQPIVLFGGATLLLGRFLADESPGAYLSLNLGARALL